MTKKYNFLDNVDFLQDQKCVGICSAPGIQEPRWPRGHPRTSAHHWVVSLSVGLYACCRQRGSPPWVLSMVACLRFVVVNRKLETSTSYVAHKSELRETTYSQELNQNQNKIDRQSIKIQTVRRSVWYVTVRGWCLELRQRWREREELGYDMY